jgi:hypothetical protein
VKIIVYLDFRQSDGWSQSFFSSDGILGEKYETRNCDKKRCIDPTLCCINVKLTGDAKHVKI